jgi:hypothetical protein
MNLFQPSVLITILVSFSIAIVSAQAAIAVEPDSHEPDDSVNQATLLTTDGMFLRHNSHAQADEDWVRFFAAAGEELVIRAENLGVRSDLVITLFDTDGNQILVAQDGPLAYQSEEIFWLVPADGTYFLRVNQFDPAVFGEETDFDLVIYQWNPAVDPDLYEPDNSPGQARRVILLDIPERHNTHVAADADWFQFFAMADEFIFVLAEELEAESDLILALFDTDGSTLLLETWADPIGINWQVPEDGNYFLKLRQYDTSVFGDNTLYNIEVGLTFPSAPLADLSVKHVLNSDVTMGSQFDLNLEIGFYGFGWDGEVATNVQTQTTLSDGVAVAEGLPDDCFLTLMVVTCNLGNMIEDSSESRTIPLLASTTDGVHIASTVFGYEDDTHVSRITDELIDNNFFTTRVVPLPAADAPPDGNDNTFIIDQSAASPVTGLWWNESESGWGVTLTQQFGVIFATIFTYGSDGSPRWFVASNCRISMNQCSGALYEVADGSALHETWDGQRKSTRSVGSVSISFQDHDNGVMSLSIDNLPAEIRITRQVFSKLSPDASMTALWWNQSESGWGVTLTQQTDVVFVTIFTYDINGRPVWYVASNCLVFGSGCEGALYEVTGGSAITEAWDDTNKLVKQVGDISFMYHPDDTGTMSFEINGMSGVKELTKQVWATH